MLIQSTSTPEDSSCDSHMQWFAMRATYHRELAVRANLLEQDIRCYVPLKRVTKVANGRKTEVMVPLVSNLVFVYCEKDLLQKVKAKMPQLQYMTTREQGRNVPIIVPDKQMSDFMAVTEKGHDMTFFEPGMINVKAGTRVRVHGGPFDGIEGAFIKISGKRNRRVVIELEGLIAVAIDCSNASSVEVI